MTTYIRYQCSICRRAKDIEQDTQHVLPNHCTITKGCAGILVALGQTAVQQDTTPSFGLTDWYPRGTVRTVSTTVSTAEMVSLATSASGAITLAVKTEDQSSLPDNIDIQLSQRKTQPVSFIDYTFKPASSQSVFTGRDASGKILRIDAAAISENRVQIRVNGVLSTPILSTNTVTFSSAIAGGSVVAVRVLLEADTVNRTLTVTRNFIQTPTTSRGSWANVDVVYRFNAGTYERWWLYSADGLSGLSIGKIKMVATGIALPTMLLLAHSPYATFDRYTDFVVPTDGLVDDFSLTLESGALTVDASKVNEIYPPLLLNRTASFVTADPVVTTSSSAVVTDTSITVMKSSKILGPT